jgi:alpha-glucuronidase
MTALGTPHDRPAIPRRQESGYECWLRYERLPGSQQPAGFRDLAGHVVVRGHSPLLLTARDELVSGLGGLLGVTPVPAASPPPAGSLVLGSADDPEIAHALSQAGVQPPSGDGFTILAPGPEQPARPGQPQGRQLVIAGGTDAGCLYGAFALLRRIATGEPLRDASTEQPAAAVRVLQHWDNMDGTVERGYAGTSIFFDAGGVTTDLRRLADYGRLLASVGINLVAPNNVNVDPAAMELLTGRHLGGLAAVAGTLRRFGIRLLLSVGFNAPVVLGQLPSADPADPDVARWWSQALAAVYEHIPDLWGLVVKADSESRPGPHSYGRTHADGANMLARALAPYQGSVLWRCFVYDCAQDWRDTSRDRARAAFDEFAPLDGQFEENVLLQVKAGPMDFQVREPASPLLGAMPRTGQLVEVQLTQEYTGQQVHVCYLVPSWKATLDFDTHAAGVGSTVADLVLRGRERDPARAGMAGVANVGTDQNWTGHLLAQANLYGFGRLAWDPDLSAEQIATEWSQLTFGSDQETIATVTSILMASWPAYESYSAPLGLGFLVTPGHHYGPSPDGYEYSRWGAYHRADSRGVGVDRSVSSGTGFAGQYQEPWRSVFSDPARCPEELLLFFHRNDYTRRLRSGKSVIQHIYDSHFDGVGAVEEFLSAWRGLRDRIDMVRFASVERRLVAQLSSAQEWRDVVSSYFHRKSGIPDERGRAIY